MKLKVILLCALALLPLAGDAQVFNQWPSQASSWLNPSLIAPATPAVTTVKASAGVATFISCMNILATPVYLHMYDASSVTLGTTAANYVLPCPGNTAGAGFVIPLPWALTFATQIKIAVTGAMALADNTSITASSVVINVGFN
jgi:hypothetical protein